MKVLFIGGTGLISSACAALALRRGVDLHILTRGKRAMDLPGDVGQPKQIVADITKPGEVRAALAGAGRFDAVVNFIAFTPEDVARDVELFTGRTGQYVLVSTCATYQKPPGHYLMDESTPQCNPFWPYAQKKIAAEGVALGAYREAGFPVTIVRPSLTYGVSRIPAAYHNSTHSWTTAHRLLTGKPVIIHGDGTSLWQVTHAEDFAKGLVGVLGLPTAIGQAFHVTTDEVLTWNQILGTLAAVLGVKANFVHVPTELIAKFDPERAQGLYGDKCHSIVLDNSKIKRFVPGFAATVPFHEGLRRTVEWFRADAARQTVDGVYDALADRIVAAWGRAFEGEKSEARS